MSYKYIIAPPYTSAMHDLIYELEFGDYAGVCDRFDVEVKTNEPGEYFYYYTLYFKEEKSRTAFILCYT